MYTFETQVADTPVRVHYVYTNNTPEIKHIETIEDNRPIHLQREELEQLCVLAPVKALDTDITL